MKEEKLFHLNRVAFAIVNGEVLLLKNSELSHEEWLVNSGIVSKQEFESLTRGLVKNNNIYFYSGDFETSKTVEADATMYAEKICNMLNMDKPATVFCGMNKGKIGELWTPKKSIKLL